MLQINNIEVVYSDVILVLRGISLAVPDNQIVSLLGANGAGKSTTLKAISGLLRTQQGEVTRGSIEWNGERIDRKSPDEIVQMGAVAGIGGEGESNFFNHEGPLRGTKNTLNPFCPRRTRRGTENCFFNHEGPLRGTKNILNPFCPRRTRRAAEGHGELLF